MVKKDHFALQVEFDNLSSFQVKCDMLLKLQHTYNKCVEIVFVQHVIVSYTWTAWWNLQVHFINSKVYIALCNNVWGADSDRCIQVHLIKSECYTPTMECKFTYYSQNGDKGHETYNCIKLKLAMKFVLNSVPFCAKPKIGPLEDKFQLLRISSDS